MQRALCALWLLLAAIMDAPCGAPVGAQAAATVDHHLFDTLLRRHVVNGAVDYDAFARAAEFPHYLQTLASVRLEGLDEDEQIAFWLNVYNAYTIQLIVMHGERESIRNINRTLGLFRLKGPWSEPLVRAAGGTYTLDEVAHRILRKRFSEPRVHAAMTDAALGSPPLRSEAYVGARLEAQLADQMRRFLGDRRKNRVRAGGVWLSPVFTAYRRDFGERNADLGEALAPYFEGAERDLLATGRFFVRTTTFDWTLNRVAAR